MEETRMAVSAPPELLLTRVQAAAWLGLSSKRLANLACEGRGPDYVRFPCGSIRYEMETLRAWALSVGRAGS